MGELIVLEEWKKQHALCELDKLESLLDQYITHLYLGRQFFMFDMKGATIEIFAKKKHG